MGRLCLFRQYQRYINIQFTVKQATICSVNTFCTTPVVFDSIFRTKLDHFSNNLNHKNGSTQRLSSTQNLNEQNIFKSIFPDIPNYQGIFLHECIWKNVRKWSNKTALVCAVTGRSYTYEQLRKLSGRFATSLRNNNLQPGDTIALILPNIPEYAIVAMGACEAGLQVTLLNPTYTAEEIKRQLNDSETVAVVTMPSIYPIIAESILDNSAIRLPVIVVEDGVASVPQGTISFKELIADNIEEFEKTGKKIERDPELDTVLIPYSSGTTGFPKGVELTHRNLVAGIYQLRSREVTTSEEAIGDHQEVMPLYLPMFHIYGFVVSLSHCLSIGAKIICMPQFSSTGLLNVLEKNRVTMLYTVPPIVQLLANDQRFTSRHMESIKHVVCAAAPMGHEVIDKFLSRHGTYARLIQGYALTEALVSRSNDAPPLSSSRLAPNIAARIVGFKGDNTGKNLGPNEIGEIHVRGPQVMKGYFRNPQATQKSMDGDWFKTGDLGYINDEGFLYIKGRIKELIKVHGYQVAPAELEDILQGHEKVADAAVIGVPHDKYGEIPKAFIVLKQNMRIEEQEIKNYIAKHVAKYKQLGHVVVIDKIPRNAAGKILRHELKKI